MEEVPRRTSLVPLAFPCFVLCLIGVETEKFLDYQGRAGIISIVRWNPRPVRLGVERGKVGGGVHRGMVGGRGHRGMVGGRGHRGKVEGGP